jgi:hypothetical protein
MGTPNALGLAAAAAALAVGILYVYRTRRTPYPPGPRGWPLIGNLFGVPSEFEWLHWATYEDRYGESIGSCVHPPDSMH